MRHLKLLTLMLCLCPVARSQDFSYGRPSDLKGLKNVYVDTGTDLKSRRRIINELNRPGLGLTLLDEPEGAEIILDFGVRTEHHDEKLIVYVHYPHPHLDTVQAHKQLLIGRGRVFVVKDGEPRSVMSFEDIKTAFWERDPATNFGRNFRKLYRKANGLK
jgi:hypothetical protein